MFDFELARVLQVVLGIGLVIFVHELGHYIAARLCGVRVETFSLGFGPRILGFRHGPTLYQLALVPLGGYCRMAGEERRFEGLAPEPDELPAKSVEARFFIYSGGVLMNLLFGLVIFPILFQVGVPFTRPVIGRTTPGGAAWRARLPEQQEVVSVNGDPIFQFDHLFSEIALGDPEHVRLTLRDLRSGAVRDFELVPERDEAEGLNMIGVTPDAERDEHGHIRLRIEPDSPAARAGLSDADRLVRVENGVPGLDERAQLDLLDRNAEPWRLVVEGDSGERVVTLAPEWTERLHPKRVGIASRTNRVRALRASPLLEELGLEEGDELLSVQDRAILALGDLQLALLAADQEPVRMRVRRGELELELRGPSLARADALLLASDIALGADELGREIVVQPGEAAERAGLRSEDLVLSVDGLEVGGWQDIRTQVERAGRESRAAEFTVRRRGVLEPITLAVTPEARPVARYGLSLRQAEYLYRAEGFGEAIVFGARYSWRFLEESWLILKRMLLRDVSPKNVGGIITISAVSYSLTEAGWIKFFFFLCLVSINLAFLNVLPIPVLDGGHLFFLVIEKLKGSPVSNRVLGTSQAVGAVLLVSLMVYVTYNDLVRWFFQP